jgi:hypothetical protein
MNTNQKVWIFVAIVVLATFVAIIGTMPSQGQQTENQDKKDWSPEKYPVADYEAPESSNASERNARREKSKRYDKKSFVIPNPRPEFIMSTIYDAEPLPSALPYKESKLVIIGDIQNAQALISNDKSAVYSEYMVQIDTVLKKSTGQDVEAGQIIFVDRSGGRVRYPNGQTILYLNDGQDLPGATGRFIFFLDKDEGSSPNFRIVTAYRLNNETVSALDRGEKFQKFNGKSEKDFIKLITSSN